MPMIEIWDGSSVELAELLDAVSSPEDLDWTILEIWAVGQTDETDVVALERQAVESPHGLNLSAVALRELADRLQQVIDGIVVGYRGPAPDRDAVDLRSTAEIVLEAIDSTLWRVYARETGVIDRLRQRYFDVRDVEPEVAIPPMHEMS